MRRTDRLEARCFTLMIAVMAILIPVAVWVSATMWSSQLELSEKQNAERVSVTAVLDADALSDSSGWGETVKISSAPATWGWGDETRHALVQVDSLATAGSEVPVWVEASTGEYTQPPLTSSAAKFTAVLSGVSLWTFSSAAAAGLFALAHWRLEVRRSREWSRDIEAFLGSTSSH
ncbi:membrane protein [Rhodococcus pyridinivorans KG-16]|uniref:Membrane protein n=1 Tax=Rhodococcus pyridinivorans KG-16 TaxID=1441730 RepID=A0A0V9UJN3_9NOCA|nr:membrane protein [Rhodococcus pyridinivorans KG-16]